MNSYSVKLKGNFQRIRKDGTVPLYLLVIINGEDKALPLNLTWPAELVDNKQGLINARSNRDKEWKDFQLIIENDSRKCNDIFRRYRIADKFLSLKLFLKEHKNYSRRLSFTKYMDFTIEDRYQSNKKEEKISFNTRRNHRSTLNKLIEYKKDISFFEIDSDFLSDFAAYLKIEFENDEGTIWARIGDIKTYLNLAEGEGFGINPDFKEYKNTAPKPRVVFLEDVEVKQLVKLHDKGIPDETLQITLKAFLFSCFTSLRISDVQLANWGWVNIVNQLKFVPYKTRKFNREVTVPLNKIGKKFIQRRSGKFFELPTDQELNRSLKDIAKRAKINKHLTFHVARHTFGTHYYRQTKDILTLQKIMGHRKIETTMVYAHVSDEDMRLGMEKMEEAFLKFDVFKDLVDKP